MIGCLIFLLLSGLAVGIVGGLLPVALVAIAFYIVGVLIKALLWNLHDDDPWVD